MADDSIVIKKIKKGGHGHHGGAWKVAYADFVTAMMAFFLLMWLLNATEAEQLAGLADYFAPTVGVKDAMGIGFRGGKSALSEGIGADINTNKGIVFGGVPTGPLLQPNQEIKQRTDEAQEEKVHIDISPNAEVQQDPVAETKEDRELKQMTSAIESAMDGLLQSKALKDNIDFRVTPEGIQIDIKNSEKTSMFVKDTEELAENTKLLLERLAAIIAKLPNYISVTGHASSITIRGRANYTSWELSSDRANSARRFLTESGVIEERFIRVVGKADNEPLNRTFPAATENNRITILLLRDGALPQHKQSAPENSNYSTGDSLVISPEMLGQ